MHPYLMEELAKAHIAALRDEAEEFRRAGRRVRRIRLRRRDRPVRAQRARIGAPADSRG